MFGESFRASNIPFTDRLRIRLQLQLRIWAIMMLDDEQHKELIRRSEWGGILEHFDSRLTLSEMRQWHRQGVKYLTEFRDDILMSGIPSGKKPVGILNTRTVGG